MNRFALWIRAIRPFSFTGSVAPVLLGALWAFHDGVFSGVFLALSVLAILLLHAGVNVSSDYDDYVNKIDVPGSYGSSGVLLEGSLPPRQVRRGGLVLLLLGAALGLVLAYLRGPLIYGIGAAGVIAGYFYTGKPLKLKYRGLGAPAVLIAFGPLMTVGSYYVQAQKFSWLAVALSIPLGLLTTAILHANDMRDMSFDKAAGIKTLSLSVGRKGATLLYNVMIYGAYFMLLVLLVFQILPIWSLVCLATLPLAFQLSRQVNTSSPNETLRNLDQKTAGLQLQFSLLLMVSLSFPLLIHSKGLL